jgi:chromosome segregation ATPase
MRDHENATTATVDLLTKEKDDLLTQHKRAEKEIITLKKQLVGAKVKITNLDKGWKVERESAEQARASVQAAKAELEAARGQVEATKKELEQRQAELDVALAEHKASAQVREQVRSTLDATVRKNETLEQGNKVLVQEILTLKKEAQARATEHAARISSIKADQELEVKPLRVNLETARRELFAARQKSAMEEKTMAELKREKEALSKKVEAQKSAEEAVARLNKELEDSTALLQKEKSTFADVVNDKNKQLSTLGTAVQTANTKASTTTQELQKLRQESKDEAARFMKRNSELGKSVEDKEAQLAKLTADMERLQTTSQGRVKENATLREKLAAQTGKLDEREQAYQALFKDLAELKRDAEQRKTTSETLQTQVTTLMANCQELEQEKQRLEANARQLEQDKERLEVDLALKSNTSPGKDEVEREMEAVAQRVRAEEEKKFAEEIARLKAENAMLSTKISSRVNDSVGASTPSPKSARTSSKRRHAEMDESEKKQYAEKVGETFFDPEGICIACR